MRYTVLLLKRATPLTLALAWLLGVGSAARAQEEAQSDPAEAEIVEQIVAVVGDSVVLRTQIDERVFQLAAQGAQLPTDAAGMARLREEILTQLINEMLIVQEALRDTLIQVDEADIESQVAQDLQQRARVYGGQVGLQQALAAQNMNLTGYRELLKGQLRRRQLQEQYIGRKAQTMGATIVVTQEEVRTFYDEQRQNFGERPATVSFAQLVFGPTPSEAAVEAARLEAEVLRDRALAGEDFEELARRNSDDPGSQQMGGDLGWFRRGDMIEEFEDVAFALGEDQIGEVVETTFGFHVIKVERRRGGEVKARHILIQPEIVDEDIGRARLLGYEIRGRIEAGEDVAALREEFGDPSQPDTLHVPMNQLGDLPPGFAEVLAEPVEGLVGGPIEYQAQGRTNFSLFRVVEFRPAGEYAFEDLQNQIRDRLREQRLLERIIEDLREKAYIDIRN